MSFRRSLDWSSAMRDIQARREVSPFLTDDGRFNLRAIMCAAIGEARRISGLTWARRLSLALRFVWAKAKKAAAAAKQAKAVSAPAPIASFKVAGWPAPRPALRSPSRPYAAEGMR